MRIRIEMEWNGGMYGMEVDSTRDPIIGWMIIVYEQHYTVQSVLSSRGQGGVRVREGERERERKRGQREQGQGKS